MSNRSWCRDGARRSFLEWKCTVPLCPYLHWRSSTGNASWDRSSEGWSLSRTFPFSPRSTWTRSASDAHQTDQSVTNSPFNSSPLPSGRFVRFWFRKMPCFYFSVNAGAGIGQVHNSRGWPEGHQHGFWPAAPGEESQVHHMDGQMILLHEFATEPISCLVKFGAHSSAK